MSGMGPSSLFRRLGVLARGRPRLVTAIGLVLVAEGARVVWQMGRGGAVALLGSLGPWRIDAVAGRDTLMLYVVWVTLGGILLLAVARRGAQERERRRRRIRPAPERSDDAPPG